MDTSINAIPRTNGDPGIFPDPQILANLEGETPEFPARFSRTIAISR
jgi:hypothetical protein